MLRDGNQAGGKVLNGRVLQYTDQQGFWKLLRRKALKPLAQCTVVGKEGKEEKLMSGAKEKGTV